MSTYIIYKHTSTTSNKSYIGVTNNLDYRTYQHKLPYSGCTAFRNAIEKYGWDDFTTSILFSNLDIEQANKLEATCILEHQTLSPYGYNLKIGGDIKITSEETKQRISASNKGRLAWNKGIPHTESTKLAISLGRRGQVHSQETKDKLRKYRLEHPIDISTRKPKAGHTLSEEHKKKISESRMGQSRPTLLATCPHCGKVGNKAAMHRHHFDKCKMVL